MAKSTQQMEKIVALCKRRGFIFQSSEIYGGIGGFWDYGPLGVELKRNIKDAWWHDMVTTPPIGPDGKEIRMLGVDCSLIMNPKVWEASGHVGGFSDPMQTCRQCKRHQRADQIWEGLRASAWMASLAEACGGSPDSEHIEVHGDRLLKWAKSKGKKVAPGLALVRSPELTLSWLSERVSDTSKPQLNIIELIQYVATEQLNKTGLITPCPHCGGDLTEPRAFNLMFKTYIGAAATEDDVAYLRPETAQGIFANYKNVLDTMRVKLPFGIAQIGKAFRNEINPRNYTFRSREFEQMEIEFFCQDEDAMKWWEWWRDVRIKWYVDLGLAGTNLRPRNQEGDELAHYSKACTDIEYCFPFADEPQELEGVAHRGCYDLTKHQEHSGKDLTYFDDDAWQRDQAKFSKDEAKAVKTKPPYRFLPTVIEPSAGADRSTLAFICEAYTVDESRPSPEVLKFHPRLAPIKAAIFPLVNKDGLPDIAEPIYKEVKRHWTAEFDVKASIGKRYARMDEAGTPFCFTIDGDTKTDGTITVRDRDTGSQEKINKSRVVEYLRDKLAVGGI